jgi:hypothetical protein
MASPSITISASDLHLSGNTTAVGHDQVAALLGQVYVIAGVVAILAIVIGGIRYAAANGDSSQIQAAKNMIMYAVVGLVVIIMAAAITAFVIQGVSGK